MDIGIQAPIDAVGGAAFVRAAEQAGVASVWSFEAWGHDAFTPLAYLAAVTDRVRLGSAIAQVGARTPAMTAMSAMSLQALSDGRFVLGLGASGPGVMEGWHGVEYAKPVTATRETIEIVRTIAAGERLDHDGDVYTAPRPGGRGRPMRSMAAPTVVPIFVAALGPANLRMTGSCADGWLASAFLPETAGVFLDEVRAGARAAGRSLDGFEVVAPAALEFTDDVEEAIRRHAAGYAFTLGAMGTSAFNVYVEAFARQGFDEDVREVQRLWLDGRRDEARRRVPTEIGDRTNLLGPPDRVRERLRAYREAGVTTLLVKQDEDRDGEDRLEDLRRLIGLVREVADAPAG